MLRGIVIFIVVVVFLLAQGPQAWSTLRSWLGIDSWSWWERNAVTAPERAQELAKNGLREQLISFEEGMSALEYRYGARPDTQRYDIYAIGVGQLTLNDPESDRRTEKVVVTGTRVEALSNELPPVFAVPTQAITGQFNNVLIFDRRDGSFTKLFDKRLAVAEFQYGWRTKSEILVLFAAERDTNENGKIDGSDLKDIYVYTFVDKKLHKIEAKGVDPQEIMDIPDVDYVVVRARRDRDNDGKALSSYDRSKGAPDPSVLIRVDLNTMTASSFVPEDMLKDLQKTLDGKSSAATSPPQKP